MRYISASDIHLGHERTPTKHIIKSFKKTILTEENKNIDVLFIAGDLFDQLLDFNSKEVHIIINFFNYLLNYCIANNVKLRILEGTPSHDWTQSETLTKLNEIRTHKCDLKYFKVLDIEYMEEYGKYILYIPDEWCNDHSDLEKQIEQKLLENNISQVDIAILHGQFAYQFLGKPYKGFYFKEDYFLKIVKGFIHIGHYHVYSSLDRIIAQGSLERLAHGEEDPKGYVYVNDNVFTFIENPYSYTYKTINITPSINIDKLDKIIHKYPEGSHIRLHISKEHPFFITYPELKVRYHQYNLKKKIKEDKSETSLVTHILTDTQLEFNEKFVLDSNIHQTLIEIVHGKYQLTNNEQNKLLNYIEIFKEVNNNESVLQ